MSEPDHGLDHDPGNGPGGGGGARALRIVHVLTRLLRAGAEENTVATCRYQAERGHEVYLVHGRDFDPRYAEEIGSTVRCIELPEMVHPISPSDDLRALRALRRLYARLRPDVIHTHQSKAGVLGRLAAPSDHGAVVHTVHIAHFLNVGRLRERLYVGLERACSRRTHAIISVSAGVMEACLERGIGRPEQHRVVHSGMDVSRFANARPPADPPFPPGPGEARPFVVLMLAAFEPRKRQERFIEAMAPVLHRRPDMRLVFCGQGARLEASRALAGRLGIAERVMFAGHVKAAEAYVAMADLCALTSEREGLPRVLVQYAAARKPMVINHLPGVESVVRDGHNGRVLPDDDVEGVAAEIERLASERDALAAMEEAAGSVDVSSWELERMGSRIESVYAEALQRVVGSAGRRPLERRLPGGPSEVRGSAGNDVVRRG